VLRVLLQFAEVTGPDGFRQVELAHNGDARFVMEGSYFAELGRTYATRTQSTRSV
jgi:hypothetical protein